MKSLLSELKPNMPDDVREAVDFMKQVTYWSTADKHIETLIREVEGKYEKT